MLRVSVLLVAVVYFVAGLAHFLATDFFTGSMPTYMPFQQQLVYLVGFIEVLGALGLLLQATRLYSAYSLIGLSVAGLPLNLNMAFNIQFYPEVAPAFLYVRPLADIILIVFTWWSVSHERVNRRASKVSTTTTVPIENKQLERVCREFIGAFEHLLTWKWDDRYQTALAEFGIENEEAVHAVLERYLKSLWDIETINTAPASIRSVVDEMGGLKPGQLLFTSESIDGTFIYCMLWPWGNQKTISIRISPLYQSHNEEEKQQQIEQVKYWFGIRQADSGWIKIDKSTSSITD